MRIVRFRDSAGDVRRGEWTESSGDETAPHEDHDVRISDGDETFALDEVEVLAPCAPSKIVCVGRNYADHAAERDADIPERPLLFLKPPTTVARHNQNVELLPGKERIDYEAELAVVISDRCRNVSAARAEEFIAGYTCMNDISNRDDQDREQNWVRGKAFDNSAPLGPVIATGEHVPDGATIELRQNGERRQRATIDQFIFSIPELVEEISRYMTLESGDVIATGTPAGVGPLADGDRIEIAIEGVGTLSHTVSIPDA